MKRGDLVISKAVTPPSSSHKLGMVLSSQILRVPGMLPKTSKVITVMFLKTNLIHCFPEHYLELISEA